MCRRLVEDKKVNSERVFLLPNWIDLRAFDAPPNASLREIDQRLSDGRKWLLVSGTWSGKYDLEFIRRVIERTVRDTVDLDVVVVGGGSIEWAQQFFEGSPRVIALGQVSDSTMLTLTKCCLLHFVALKPGMDSMMLPSRLLPMLASKRPILISAEIDGQVASDLKGRSMFVPNQDIDEIISYVTEIASGRVNFDEQVKQARLFVERDFSKDSILLSVSEKLTHLSAVANQ